MILSPSVSPWRMGLLLFFLAACTLALVIRIGYLQIVQHQEFVQRADAAHWSRQALLAHRGAVKERGSNPLALSLETWEVSLDPVQLATGFHRDRSIALVSEATSIPTQQIYKKLEAANGRPVLLTEGLEYTRGKTLVEYGIPGVLLQERVQRIYPEGNLAATLIGIVGRDRAGLMGIEADFDRDLAGVPGTLVFERDSLGNPIPLGYRSGIHPKAGGDVVLTLDRYIQRVVERELEAAVKRHQAAGGTIIVMEPQTGAVLALASRPTFDLRNPNPNDAKAMELLRNRALTDLYEPGSTFKLFTMAAALNEGLVTPDTKYFDGGPVIKYGRAINTWNGRHFGWETMTELLMHSNNVGAVWVSDKLGPERFYPYVEKFGFGQPTNIGLSGEAQGQVRTPKDKDWWPIDLATNAFGQGISVTPLQMATAVSAIVNGGTLMRPYVVQRIESPEGVRTIRPVPVRQVMSPEAARQLRVMMHAAAEKGESKLALVPGFRIGGKTGTASVPGAGTYHSDATIASFVGFIPYEDPKAVILVKIDHPKDSPWGSVVASPVFSTVAREMLVYWRVPPSAPPLVAKAQ